MKKVLVIDDEQDLRDVVKAALGGEGYEVEEAGSGQEGIDLARAGQPDLILCDVNMQGMDGYATLERIRQDTVTAAIPVILMTGVMRDYSSVRHAMGIGADDYLLKPFSVDDLLAAIKTRLQKQQVVVEKAESKLNELRSSIALSLPHELRTPLVAILGFSDLLNAYYETMDRKEIGAMAVDIHKAANRLHALIEDFLIYAQIELTWADESKRKALAREQTSDVHVVVKILSRQKAQEVGRSNDLQLDLKEGSARISSGYFEKILSGLLDNAFKFSETGTSVLVRGVPEETSYVFSITDRGRGMTSEQIQNVGGYMQFERKIHEQQGSGLGLIIAKRLTELHGGILSIESTLGKGTTVVVKLPAA